MARRQIFVDGYNVIHRHPPLAALAGRNLEMARTGLLNLVNSSRAFRNDAVTVVFDGTKGGQAYQSSHSQGRVRVVFTRLGETADEVIVRLVAATGGETRVISDDRGLRELAAQEGATAMGIGRRPPPRAPGRDEDEERRPDKKGPSHRAKKRRGGEDPYWRP
ncbi:MAG: NYN domain-containing protein [Chloroflexota bacterium]